MQVEKIKVEMLGGFSVWVNDKILISDAPKLTKPWQLFCYLILNREKFVESRKLIAMLWADDVLADPANVLKNAVYSLRKELCGGESFTDSPLIYSSGGYRFDPAVELELDVDDFVALCARARQEKSAGLEERAALFRQALDAYKGDFLPQLDQDLWVVPLVLEHKQRYMECANEFCDLLWKNKQFKEMLNVASMANMIDPVDEASTVFLFRALEALRMYRVIVTSYSKTSRYFEDTFGSQPPTEVRKIYAGASERINKTEQDIIVIKTELSGIEGESRPQRGAYFCTYNSLKHIYPLLKRAAERSSQVLVLALFTLAQAKTSPTANYDLARIMAEFKVVAMNNLRKADAIARYSKNQYVMLLTVNSLEDGRLVRDRIRESFAQGMAAPKVLVDIKLTEV
ncbi:MAG: BTAD domain-containing putative transcriptional regulator [Oscillospiraceae bacterium]